MPKGYFAFKSPTYNVFLFFRTIMKKGDDGPDPKPAVALAEQTRVYPLWAVEKEVKPMQFPNGSGKRVNMIYPVDNTYWTKLKAFVDYEPVSAIGPELRGVLASIGIIKGQPFNPTDQQRALLKKAVETAPKMIMATRQLGRPDGRQLYYKDRHYQNTWAGATSEWLQDSYLDVNQRAAYFQIAYSSAPAMVMRTLGAGSKYPFTTQDVDGNFLSGSNTYKLRLPPDPPIACPNQDVVYGLGFFDLDKQPVIAQVPDFGGRFWVYALYDARTDQFGELGKPYGTKPGFYLLVGPNWKGAVPNGVTAVIRSSTALANAIPRVFMDDTDADRAAIQPFINQIVFYPLSEFDGKMKTKDWSKAPSIPGPASSGGGETKWVVPDKFFDQLPEVLDEVPPLPGEEALYAQFRNLLAVAKRDPETKKVLVNTAIATEKEVIEPFFRWQHNGKPAGNGWNRSVNNAKWGVDYFDRTGTAKSNMFDNTPNETQYFYTDLDSSAQQLDGTKSYSVTFAAGQEPPINGFWSLTLYNEHHFFYPNDLHRFSLGTKNKGLQRDSDGSLTLYVGATSPGQDKQSNWLPAPKGPFSLYIRAYWGQQPILDGSWQPPKIQATAAR